MNIYLIESDLCTVQVDFGYFGPPEEHLEWTEEEREATYITPDDPSSEIAGEVTATFAATAIAFKETGALPCPAHRSCAVGTYMSTAQAVWEVCR